MAEFETGPLVLPGSARDVIAGKLRRSTLFPEQSFDESGCFGVIGHDFRQNRYFSDKLLGFDPGKYNLRKYADRTYFIVPKNIAPDDQDEFIGRLRISAYNALHLPFETIRPVDRRYSGLGMVNEDGDLHLQSGQLANKRFTMRVEPSHMGSPLYMVVFDSIKIDEERTYIKPDGVAILINDKGQRRLVPRQIRV